MVKHEIKIELEKTEEIRNIIQKAYYEDGFGGKIVGKQTFILFSLNDSTFVSSTTLSIGAVKRGSLPFTNVSISFRDDMLLSVSGIIETSFQSNFINMFYF